MQHMHMRYKVTHQVLLDVARTDAFRGARHRNADRLAGDENLTQSYALDNHWETTVPADTLEICPKLHV